LVAVQLFRNGYRGRVAVVEPREQLGAGLAYSTQYERHLLNVPAGKMSALADEPAHFLEWLRAGPLPHAEASTFAPRRLYGKYLNDLLQQTIAKRASGEFIHLRAEAIDVGPIADGAVLTLSDGSALKAERVVLALGNPASSPLPGIGRHGLEDRWHASPWLGDALRSPFSGERILLLGTGLTAVDSTLALLGREPDCKVLMLSRRGIVPQIHNLKTQAGSPPDLVNYGSLRLMLRELRDHVESARQAGRCWRASLDALRPISNDLWRKISLADQRRFSRHLKAYWEPHRHRMAPEIGAHIAEYRENGALQVVAGRLLEMTPQSAATQVKLLSRRGAERVIEVDRIISCTGIHESYADSPRPLIRSLVKGGLARANDLGIGLSTDLHGALLDANGRPSPVFSTLGPPRRGELFETTAVPEIRSQAQALALQLVACQVEEGSGCER
jgi:uncharacterized NAD(P)/FAD-binding protein YdhS